MGQDVQADHLRALLALHEVLGDADSSLEQVLERAVDGVARLVGDAAGLWLDGPTGVRMRAFDHCDPQARAYMARVVEAVSSYDDGLISRTMTAGQSVRTDAAGVERLLPLMAPALREHYGLHRAAGMLLVPLTTRDRPIGVIGVTRDAGGQPFDDDDLTYLRQIAGVVSLAVGTAQLLEAAEDVQRRTTALAHEDELTGLLNRRGFLEVLRTGLLERPADATIVLVLDLDGFKHVNDGFGRAAGDQVLNSVARRVCDVVPSTVPVARLGGDQFALLVQEEDEETAAALVERVVQACTATVQVVGLSVPVTVSAGTAVPGEGGPDELLQRAHLAKYRAKRQLGSYVAMYDERLDAPATRRLRDVLSLRNSLRSGDLVVHYQPVVDVQGGPLRLEALARLRRADRLVPPEGFLRLADQAGLMPELTACVLDEVVAQLASWWRDGHRVECAVNVPATVLAQSGLVPGLVRRLELARLPRNALSVEVTESDLVGPGARAALTRCSEAGIAVAVDDFGTGWSSLAYLVELPLQALKIDRSFVEGVETDVRRAAVVRALVQCAHDLGLQVVAEGVETETTAQALVRLGVDALQGYRYGRPMSAQDLVPLLERRVVPPRP